MTEFVAVDSSALVAIFNGEAEEDAFLSILGAGRILIGWPTVLETRIWLLRWMGDQRQTWFADWLDETELVAFDRQLEAIAASAYQRFGKGRHPAALNYGDCMSYAVALRHEAPLLFKGGDFGKTDVKVHTSSVLL